MTLDVLQLLQFVAVGEELSFRKAADRLQIAQPWLSRQIGRLEAELGFKLFHRTTRHVELTVKGERLFIKARKLARELEATRALGLRLTHETPGRLRIGVPFFALRAQARIELFRSFNVSYPAVKLHVITGDPLKLNESLSNGDLDGLFSTGPVNLEGLEAVTLVERNIQAVLHPRDPLLEKDAVCLDDFRGRAVAVFQRHINPALHDELFGFLEGYAGKFIERDEFLYTYGLDGLNAVSVAPSWSPAGSGVDMMRPISDHSQLSRLQFIRREDAHSEFLDAFWDLAIRRVSKPKSSRVAPA